ncbi:MAG: E3 binding domain-containing protein, partial [Rhodanobacter sp.]
MADLKEARVPDIGHADVPVIEVLVKVGDEVSEGAVIALIEAVDAADSAPSGESRGEDKGEGAESRSNSNEEASSTPAKAAQPVQEPPAPAPAEPPPSPIAGQGVAPGNVPEGDIPHPRPPVDASIVMPGDSPYASPAIRAFARELGVDVRQVKGSGRHGRIQRDDVSAWVKHALASGARPSQGASASLGGLNLLPWPKIDFAKFGEIEEKPLSRIQKISG